MNAHEPRQNTTDTIKVERAATLFGENCAIESMQTIESAHSFDQIESPESHFDIAFSLSSDFLHLILDYGAPLYSSANSGKTNDVSIFTSGVRVRDTTDFAAANTRTSQKSNKLLQPTNYAKYNCLEFGVCRNRRAAQQHTGEYISSMPLSASAFGVCVCLCLCFIFFI